MGAIALDNLVSVTVFNRGQASRVFERLKDENQLVVLKNNQPEAIILSPEEYKRLSQIEEDYLLLSAAQRRMEQNCGKQTVPQSKIMERYGLTEEDIAAVGDVEIE